MVRLAVLATQTISEIALRAVEELFGGKNVEGLNIS